MTTTATFTKKRHKISEKTNENLDSINRTPSTKNKRFSAFLARYILNIVYTLLLMLTLKLCWFLYFKLVLNSKTVFELLNSLIAHICLIPHYSLLCQTWNGNCSCNGLSNFPKLQNLLWSQPQETTSAFKKKKEKFLNSSPRLRDQGGGLASWTGDPPPSTNWNTNFIQDSFL